MPERQTTFITIQAKPETRSLLKQIAAKRGIPMSRLLHIIVEREFHDNAPASKTKRPA